MIFQKIFYKKNNHKINYYQITFSINKKYYLQY